MKKFLYIFAFVSAILLASSCQKGGEQIVDELVGDWHCTTQESGVQTDVYLGFAADGTFRMYQKIGDGPYWSSTGEYTMDAESKVLSGVYSDRYPWKYSYRISVNGRSLTMTAVELDTYVVRYERTSIPEAVLEKSVPLTKSESYERYL